MTAIVLDCEAWKALLKKICFLVFLVSSVKKLIGKVRGVRETSNFKIYLTTRKNKFFTIASKVLIPRE